MDYRNGKCSQCGAEYKVPASFAHDVARCKECSGVVRIEPAAGSGAPVPAKKVEKRPAPTGPVPVERGDADQKRKERGTLAKLKAQRAAQSTATTKPAGQTARPAAAKARSATPAARPSKPAAAVMASASSRPGGRSRRAKGGDEEGGARHSRRGTHSREKKGFPVGGIIAVSAIALMLIGGGLYFGGVFGGGDEVEANETAQAPEPAADTAPVAEDEPAVEEAAPSTEDAAPEEAPEPPPAKVVDPASVDLTAIADFGPARGCTQEQWDEMNELMATFMDLDAGAAGPRAGRKLEEMGRLAMPVMINFFKTVDFSTDAGVRQGDMIQRAMKEICNGSNFDYRYETTPENQYFNKKVVEAWAKAWAQVVTDVNAWIRLAKLEDKDPDEAARLRAEYGDATAEPAAASGGGADDLEVD